jgi:actin-like ATPase involved in cell morphogenesis
MSRKSLNDLLLDANLIDEKQLQAAVSEQARWNNSIARTLYEMRLVDENDLVQVQNRYYNIELVDLGSRTIDAATIELVGPHFCREHCCLPFSCQDKFLDVALFDPSDAALLDQLRVRTKCNIRPHLAAPSAILDAIDRSGSDPAEKPNLQFSLPAALDDLSRSTDGGPSVPPPAARDEALPGMLAQIAQRLTRVEGLHQRFESLHQRLEGLQQRLEQTAIQHQRLEQVTERTDRLLQFLVEHLLSRGAIPVPPTDLLRKKVPDLPPPATSAPEPAPAPPAKKPSASDVEIELPPIFAALAKPASGVQPAVGTISEKQPAGPAKPTSVRPAVSARAVPPAPPDPARGRTPSVEIDIDLPDEESERPAAAAAPPTPADAGARTTVLLSTPKNARQVVAIDFGTTWSSVATVIDGQVELLRLPDGGWEMPSVVGFRRDGTVMLGHAARKMLADDPSNAIASPKRILGRRHNDPLVAPFLQSLAMKSLAGPNGEILLEARDKQITPTEACAHILHLLRLVAQRHLGHDTTDVLLTTPVSFGRPQHEALRRAAELAGMKVVEFIDEPVAAALSNQHDPEFHGLVAVYDFGGGTFDFSVTEVSASKITVVTTAGDTWLGGDDMDEVLAAAACNAFWREYGIELRNQVLQWQRILIAAEKAKRELSTHTDTTLRVSNVAMTGGRQLDLHMSVTRAQLAGLVQDVIQRSLDTCREALDLNGIAMTDLNAIYLSGGSCYIPAVREAVTRFFRKEPRSAVPCERAVLVGAALHGAGFGISAPS